MIILEYKLSLNLWTLIQHEVIFIKTTYRPQNLIICISSLCGVKNWDSSLSTETGYTQDSQVSVTSKGSAFFVCQDIQATLGSTQSPPFHTAKFGVLHHCSIHMHDKYYIYLTAISLWACHKKLNSLNIFNVYVTCVTYRTSKSNNVHVHYLHCLIKKCSASSSRNIWQNGKQWSFIFSWFSTQATFILP
jgi:hypothetical protein